MTSRIIVRTAAPGEEHLVFALMRAGFAESASNANPSSALMETFEGMDGTGIVAFDDGRPAGSGRFSIDRADGFLSYERLAVLPALRGRGIGSAMVTFLEFHARDLGLSEVRADARSEQPDNRPFYLGRGYRIVGYAERYGIPEMCTHLAKLL